MLAVVLATGELADSAALVSLAMWIYIFVSAPAAGIVFSAAFLAVAVGADVAFDKKTAAPLSKSGRHEFSIPNILNS